MFASQRPNAQTQGGGVGISAEHSLGTLPHGDVGNMDMHIVVVIDCSESHAGMGSLVDVDTFKIQLLI